jgi:exopolysaccharide production protein ExoY
MDFLERSAQRRATRLPQTVVGAKNCAAIDSSLAKTRSTLSASSRPDIRLDMNRWVPLLQPRRSLDLLTLGKRPAHVFNKRSDAQASSSVLCGFPPISNSPPERLNSCDGQIPQLSWQRCMATAVARSGRVRLSNGIVFMGDIHFTRPPLERDSTDSLSGPQALLNTNDASDSADRAAVPLWKRGLDICCLLIAVPSLLPLMAMVAVLIKLTSKGPVLFRQERVGLFGRKFTLFKFRTMIVGADTTAHEQYVAGLIGSNRPMIKMDGSDKRLIPVGRLLRAAGLDELPQFINVAKGEMSLVGPRPSLPGEYQRFSPWQRARCNTLPGLTGLWQVSGKNRTTFDEMIEYDLQYVRTQSLWLDLKIMLKTIPAVLMEVKDAQSLPATPVALTSASRSASTSHQDMIHPAAATAPSFETQAIETSMPVRRAWE